MSLAQHHLALSAEDVAEIAEINRIEADLLGLIANLATHHPTGGREFALARTNLQQAVFWAVKGIIG